MDVRHGALLALAYCASTACAQTPGRAGSGAASSLVGVVRDANGAPLADVNVSLVGETLETRSDSNGQFQLRGLAAGGHTVLFRRIGFYSAEHRWVAQAGGALQLAVSMVRVSRQLERVVIEAPGVSRRRGTSSIGGTVLDSAGRLVDAAEVRLLGTGLSTITDSTGRFQFGMLAAGSYIVRMRRCGFSGVAHVIQIADDDSRELTLKMFDLPKRGGLRDVAAASACGAEDAGYEAFDRRGRANFADAVLGPGDLFRADGESLDVLLQRYRSAMSNRVRRSSTVGEGVGSTDAGDCLLIDGRRANYQPLRSFMSRDVQLVEVFGPYALVDAYLVSQMSTLDECRGSADHHPTYFALWTRSLR